MLKPYPDAVPLSRRIESEHRAAWEAHGDALPIGARSPMDPEHVAHFARRDALLTMVRFR